MASAWGGGSAGGEPPVAGGSGPPGGAAPDTVRQLVQELQASGRQATASEMQRLRVFLADQVLPTATDLQADTPAGRYARDKYDEHVRTRREWPPETTPADYLATLRAAVRSAATGVRLYADPDRQEAMLLFLARTRQAWRGPHGQAYLVVLFNAERRWWVTGYQVRDGLRYTRRQGGWWIRRPH